MWRTDPAETIEQLALLWSVTIAVNGISSSSLTPNRRICLSVCFTASNIWEGFDFGYIRSKDVDKLKSLSSLATLHANRNLAFIGPQGVGKTHLAMAYGRECCLQGYKTYFLKATELNQRFSEAIKYGREGSVVNGLVKPSCLIIDEIGRCVFNKENTRLFFDMVDRRYSKEGPNSIESIVTSCSESCSVSRVSTQDRNSCFAISCIKM